MGRYCRSVVVVASALAVLPAGGCGSASGDAGLALQARGGAYVDGTGRLGLAVLTTLRDVDGGGPPADWTGTVSGPFGPVGGDFSYSGSGSWAAVWWPEEPGYAGTYSLTLAPAGGSGLSASFDVGDETGIAPPQPSLSEAGTSLSWDPVPGAMSYECRVQGHTGTALGWLGAATSCDLSGLAAGAYTASVLAFSADLVSIAASASRRPALPVRFDVSEARLAFSRTDVAPPIAVLGAAGGAFHDGTSWAGRGLAVWVSIVNPDGTPTADSWTIELVGPGLPTTAPLSFTYPANFARLMVWSAAVPASPGSYGLVARSTLGALARPFTVESPRSIGAPTDIAANAGAQGSASVTWTAVAGATSYLVAARHRATFAFVMSQWVAEPAASFPADTFVAGEPYDVFVAATDADMVAGTAPAQFAITENSFQPAGFVGR